MKKRSVERTMFYGATPGIFEKAKLLRLNMTEAEKKLWEALNNKKFKGYRFKSQHPIQKFIVDFYCHNSKLVIEIDGEIHQNMDVNERDIGRTYELENFNLKIIRFTNQQVLTNLEEVIKVIELNL